VIRVRIGKVTISFDKSKVAGSFEIAGRRRPFPDGIVAPEDSGSNKVKTP